MSIRTRIASLVCALCLILPMVGAMTVAASAQTQATASITGSLVDQAGGVSIANADVSLYQGNTRVAQTKSEADGSFAFPAQSPGIYRIEIRAEGYEGARSDDVAVTSGNAIPAFRVALNRSTTNGSQLREIGRVSSSTGRNSVSTSTTISQTVSSDLIRKEGYVRIGDALNTLPGVNVTGLSSSVGDDQGINIRGFGSSETQTLLDGHPIGPTGPGSSGFSYQVSPSFAIGQTVVTYGSGALGLYGTDSIGGTVDMQTLNPTRTKQFLITQGYGNQGIAQTVFQATGTLNNRFGYALVHAVEGTYGPYPTAVRPQNGLLGTDLSDANLSANTYTTSGNYLLHNDLLKLKYDFSEKTSLTASMLSANSWNDKSGNGDNCYFDNNLQLYTAQQIIAGGANTYPSNANPGDAGSITCTGTIAVNTNNGPACYTAQQYAARTTGLVGGGAGPWQAHRVLDFHTRLTSMIGKNNLITVDGFTNRLTTDYNRNLSGGTCDQDATCSSILPKSKKFIGGFFSNFVQTTGALLSDDIATERNDFGFGYYFQHQDLTGDKFDNAGSKGVLPTYAIIPTQSFTEGDSNFFVRDDYKASDKTSIYFNGWLKHSTVTEKTTFDPRVSFVFRTSPADVIRLTGGRSDGNPAPNLTSSTPNLNTTPTNITPKCNALTGVGSTSNSLLHPEQSTDLEVGYGHRFGNDSIVQVDLYSSNETNRIFSGVLPVSVLGAGAIPPNLLQQYYARIASFCPGKTPTLNDLSVSTNYNAATARFRGIELSGRARVNRQFYVDYTYDVQSAVYNDLSDTLLARNVFNINGAQLNGLPLHKGSIGLDYSSRGGFETRLDTIYLGNGNAYYRPAFAYSNASFSQRFGKYTTLNVGVLNIFNSASSSLYDIGGSVWQPENKFGTDLSAIDQAYNQQTAALGLIPTSVTVSITRRF